MKSRYRYLMIFNIPDGSGNCKIDHNKPFLTTYDLDKIKDEIENINNLENVIITNWKRVR